MRAGPRTVGDDLAVGAGVAVLLEERRASVVDLRQHVRARRATSGSRARKRPRGLAISGTQAMRGDIARADVFFEREADRSVHALISCAVAPRTPRASARMLSDHLGGRLAQEVSSFKLALRVGDVLLELLFLFLALALRVFAAPSGTSRTRSNRRWSASPAPSARPRT